MTDATPLPNKTIVAAMTWGGRVLKMLAAVAALYGFYAAWDWYDTYNGTYLFRLNVDLAAEGEEFRISELVRCEKRYSFRGIGTSQQLYFAPELGSVGHKLKSGAAALVTTPSACNLFARKADGDIELVAPIHPDYLPLIAWADHPDDPNTIQLHLTRESLTRPEGKIQFRGISVEVAETQSWFVKMPTRMAWMRLAREGTDARTFRKFSGFFLAPIPTNLVREYRQLLLQNDLPGETGQIEIQSMLNLWPMLNAFAATNQFVTDGLEGGRVMPFEATGRGGGPILRNTFIGVGLPPHQSPDGDMIVTGSVVQEINTVIQNWLAQQYEEMVPIEQVGNRLVPRPTEAGTIFLTRTAQDTRPISERRFEPRILELSGSKHELHSPISIIVDGPKTEGLLVQQFWQTWSFESTGKDE